MIGDFGQQCNGGAHFSCFDPLNGKIADPNFLGQLFHAYPSILSDLPDSIAYLHGGIVSKSEYMSSQMFIFDISFVISCVVTEA